MIFMFDLELPDLTDARGDAVARDCIAAGAWPVSFVPGRVEHRWFGIKKAFPPVLEIATVDPGGPILAPSAARDAHAIALRPGAVEALAATLAIVDEHFRDGFVFRATWAGSPILRDEAISVRTLSERVRASALNEFTRYRVGPSPRRDQTVSRETYRQTLLRSAEPDYRIERQ